MATAVRLLAALAAASAVTSITLSACSASVSLGKKTIDKATLQEEVQSQLSKSVGQEAPPISCPADLDAKVDATTTCTLTDANGTYDVSVKVTSVDDGAAKFDIQVADKPNP